MRRGTLRTAALGLLGSLVVGCTGSADRPVEETAGSPAERAYWPTEEWRTAPPDEHGLDAGEIAEVERLVAESYTNVRSILVVRDGFLVYERYWQGLDGEDGHDTRSVTKSVVGALVGIALGQGLIESLDQTVGDLLADRLPPDADPRMRGVTVRELLSMTSGLPPDDPSLGGDPGVFQRAEREPDLVRALLGLRLTADPGTRWAYSSASSHLLSVIVADAAGTSTLDYADDRLFGPLGIDVSDAFVPLGPPTQETIEEYDRARVAWPADAQGHSFGGGFLKLPARDLARFGYLYLNGGRWDDEQVVPAEYVRASTTASVGTVDRSADYGWHWWVAREEGGAFFARGYGGQLVYVDPRRDLVVVVTSDPATPRGDVVDLVAAAILPAAGD